MPQSAQPQAPLCPPSRQAPEGLPLHVLIRDAMIDQSLIPDGISGVPQGFRTKFVGLEPRQTSVSVGSQPCSSIPWAHLRWVGDLGVHFPQECPGALLLPNACSQGVGSSSRVHHQHWILGQPSLQALGPLFELFIKIRKQRYFSLRTSIISRPGRQK